MTGGPRFRQHGLGVAAFILCVTTLAAGCSSAPSAGTQAAVKSAGASALPAEAGSGSKPSGGGAGWTYLDPGGSLHGYGWSRCTTTVTVSADTSYLDAAAADRVRAALKEVASLWTSASGMDFTSVGSVPMKFESASQTLVPVDGPARPDHIYLALEPEVQAPRLDGGVVGLGTPTLVLSDEKRIVGGEAVFESEYVNAQSKAELIHLFAHEIGHILGLGHSPDKGNIMYSVVTDQTKLGPGDVAGINAVMRPCASATAQP